MDAGLPFESHLTPVWRSVYWIGKMTLQEVSLDTLWVLLLSVSLEVSSYTPHIIFWALKGVKSTLKGVKSANELLL